MLDSSKPGAVTTELTRGFPSVRVPVLSTTKVSTFSNRSRDSAFLTRTPAPAPLPTPTMIDIGVASPSAHGHAMISTDTAATTARPSAGAGAQIIQAANAAAADTMTAGTNQPAAESARRWMGARLRCASATILTMRDNTVSEPTFSAVITSDPVPLMVPPMTLAPGAFATGMDSPVTIDSSIAPAPSVTDPSTGTASPGLTRSRSPT